MSKLPSKSLIKKLKGNLSSGEEVKCYLKTFVVVERPDYIILTNLRIVYFNEKHLGRYEFRSIPFQKLLRMRAHRGTVLWGDISFESEDTTEIKLEKVDHNEMRDFIKLLEIAYNSIAVEPITIKHEKDLLGKEKWEFDKPKEVIFRQQPSFPSYNR